MAVKYVDMDSGFPESQRLQVLAEMLQCSANEALGMVARLHCWLGRQIPHEGQGAVGGGAHLATICQWRGDAEVLVRAMCHANVVEAEEDGRYTLDGSCICWGAERSDLCRSSEENDYSPPAVDVFGPTVEEIRQARDEQANGREGEDEGEKEP